MSNKGQQNPPSGNGEPGNASSTPHSQHGCSNADKSKHTGACSQHAHYQHGENTSQIHGQRGPFHGNFRSQGHSQEQTFGARDQRSGQSGCGYSDSDDRALEGDDRGNDHRHRVDRDPGDSSTRLDNGPYWPMSNVVGGKLKLKTGKTTHRTSKKRGLVPDNLESVDTSSIKKTKAEEHFEEIERKKTEEILLQRAKKTHRERIEEYNVQLSKLSEHHDLPRIGPG